MRFSAEGIVFKGLPLGEADMIMTIFTRQKGFVRAFAKSPRKTKSRFGSALEPFSYIRLSLWGKENAELPRLIQADIVHPFQKLREELKCFLRVSEIFEMTFMLIPEHVRQERLFDILLDTLRMQEQDCMNPKAILCYKIKMLAAAGFMPRLNGCARCAGTGRRFYFREGSILCDNCSGNGNPISGFELSPGAIKLFETLRLWDWSKLNRVVPSDGLARELGMLLDLHIRYRLEKGLKTRDFIENIKTKAAMP
ncbi:DNA repair protein RecO [Candidatus Magnetominusculus xianensis]|uniref:DNA repair protein RecO n=1 Tax=Candidatus Magnetominusculus xianensis TaxID=1748249 RepID=A0ABR5SF18_9BACT|nr:DNA repair protein RecO [Candidatus Magnetominusculus xianensis]KWT84008.1 DNA repair protein RecO [Candidatus Magnetominusculus xianensis]MBF0405384.1 DNA repair protein RecO [Nitrospirota bacterium]